MGLVSAVGCSPVQSWLGFPPHQGTSSVGVTGWDPPIVGWNGAVDGGAPVLVEPGADVAVGPEGGMAAMVGTGALVGAPPVPGVGGGVLPLIVSTKEKPEVVEEGEGSPCGSGVGVRVGSDTVMCPCGLELSGSARCARIRAAR